MQEESVDGRGPKVRGNDRLARLCAGEMMTLAESGWTRGKGKQKWGGAMEGREEG